MVEVILAIIQTRNPHSVFVYPLDISPGDIQPKWIGKPRPVRYELLPIHGTATAKFAG